MTLTHTTCAFFICCFRSMSNGLSVVNILLARRGRHPLGEGDKKETNEKGGPSNLLIF
jgi:hypothetical protein